MDTPEIVEGGGLIFLMPPQNNKSAFLNEIIYYDFFFYHLTFVSWLIHSENAILKAGLSYSLVTNFDAYYKTN